MPAYRKEFQMLLKTKEVSKLLNLSTIALYRMRQRKIGPPYLKFKTGIIRYDKDELINWIEKHRVTNEGVNE